MKAGQSTPRSKGGSKKIDLKKVPVAAPKKHGFKKGWEDEPPPPKAQVVYLHPSTGKPVKRATKKPVLYALKSTTGEISVLHPIPQPPDQRLKSWLEKRAKAQPGNMVVYTQQSRAVMKPGPDYEPAKMEKVLRGVLYRRKPRESEYKKAGRWFN